MKRALFIFRRDLRLPDNKGLLSALKAADQVVLSFIFTPEQIENNPYRGDRSLQFMIESLEDLEEEIVKQGGNLYLFYGKPESVVEKCINQLHVDGVFVNRDYTPYSIQRDKDIAAVCAKYSVPFEVCDDLLLHPIEDTLKSDGKPYTMFTPFHRHASKQEVDRPELNRFSHYYSQPIRFGVEKTIYEKILPKREPQQPGGRRAGLAILKAIQSFVYYASDRDLPAQDKTTHLSAHLKFTTCSIREVYYAILHQLGPESALIRSLYWRDFFTLIAFHFPYVFQGAFKLKYNNLKWKEDTQRFKLWCEGKTGFPIVDAGMRELNHTGFMHNRVRMITASFLVKDLHINWQWGERYFAQKLIDYDPAVNNGNWQWSASTGCDAQPYFRIFNPWSQAEKFDPDCFYIKKWVKELELFSPKEIHSWHLEKNHSLCNNYPSPMLDHAKEASLALEIYRNNP